MARTGLKEFQQALALRLRDAAQAEPTSRLGVQAGGQRYLIRLDDAGEVLPVPQISAVPLTRPWFLGLANVRGNLVSVIDFAAFMGEAPTPRTPDSRLVLFNERYGAHGGLLVARMLGLKNVRSLEPQEAPAARAWVGAAYREKGGAGDGDWRDLDLGALVGSEDFLQVGA